MYVYVYVYVMCMCSKCKCMCMLCIVCMCTCMWREGGKGGGMRRTGCIQNENPHFGEWWEKFAIVTAFL